MTSAMDLPVRITRSQELTKNADNDSELPDKTHPTILCAIKCSMIQTTAVHSPHQDLEKSLRAAEENVCLEVGRSRLDSNVLSVPYLHSGRVIPGSNDDVRAQNSERGKGKKSPKRCAIQVAER